jgi:hypothetical protein
VNKLVLTDRQHHGTPISGRRTLVEITLLPKISSDSQVNVTIPKLVSNIESEGGKSWFKNNIGRLLCRELRMAINSWTVYNNKLESLIMVYKDLWIPDERHEDMSEYGIARKNLRKLMSGHDSANTG